jgi:hypothetical protein
MRKMRTEREDLPKIVASVMVAVPGLGIRTGLIYLKTKRRLHQNAKRIYKGMVEGGLPEETARRLANSYEEELSVRKLVRGIGVFRS